MDKALKERLRYFLKDTVRQTIDFSRTDQSRGVPPPAIEKSYVSSADLIPLVPARELEGIAPVSVYAAIENRQSRRVFRKDPLSMKELSFLLWATQGIRRKAGPATAFRTVPSAGCRHALETYLCVLSVEELGSGIYRYLPLEHSLLGVARPEGLSSLLAKSALGQEFVGRAAATFIWTAVPYRMEWRYDAAAHKVIAIDAGHVCQNLYIACEAIGAGTCAVAAYDQELMDSLLGVDGDDEFVIYLAPVGKV